MSKARKPDPQMDIRRAILAAALERAPSEGWTGPMLAHAAKTAGIDGKRAAIAFPKGATDLIAFWSEELDGLMVENLAAVDVKSLRMRERIATAVRARIEALAPNLEAARRAAGVLALPQFAPLALSLAYHTADRTWRWAGDTSTDFNYYTKRALAAGVYLATLVYWFRDGSPDKEETWRFLERRIADVMSIEGVKAQIGKFAGQLPSPFALLGALRYPERDEKAPPVRRPSVY